MAIGLCRVRTEAQPGVLMIGADEEIALELIGGFDLDVRIPLPSGNGFSFTGEQRELPLVHGTCEGTSITLVHCHQRIKDSRLRSSELPFAGRREGVDRGAPPRPRRADLQACLPPP